MNYTVVTNYHNTAVLCSTLDSKQKPDLFSWLSIYVCVCIIKSLKKEQHHLLIIYTLYRHRAVLAMLVTIYVLAILVLGGAQSQQQQDEEEQSCSMLR